MPVNMKTMLYKACPRCGGDLMLDNSSAPPEYTCIQCGRTVTLAALLEHMQPQPAVRRLVA